jgi:hypothetical protein
MTSYFREEFRYWNQNPSYTRFWRRQSGFLGNHVDPLGYVGLRVECNGFQTTPDGLGFAMIDAHSGVAGLNEFLSLDGVPEWAQYAVNKAYNRFRDKALGEKSALGVTFAQWKQSLGTITKALNNVIRSVDHLRRREFRRFIKSMDFRLHPKHKHLSKAGALDATKKAADTWLEYWFGWSADFADIYQGIQVLGGRLPQGNVARASAKADHNEDFSNGIVHYISQRNFRCVVKGEVFLTNPNEFLLQQLGLANPLQVAWELVPWSFLIDWVTDVSSFLGSFTDFLGVEIRKAFTSKVGRGTELHDYGYPLTPRGLVCTANWGALVRTIGIPTPIPNLNAIGNLGRSLTRAASAASLLVQQLSKLRHAPV